MCQTPRDRFIMKRKINYLLGLFLLLCSSLSAQQKPNVVMIYVDDLGYGDLSSYGADKLHTPHIDQLAETGIRFTNAHAAAATCTPSRYALMSGQYPFRKSGTGVLPGDAALIIDTQRMTLPLLFQQSGYATAIVGKWHLGLGNQVEKNWNESISPGPLEVGYGYSFIFPATADRVPTVFLENHHVLGLDPSDPIEVSYQQKVGDQPTGLENPELLKMKSSLNHGHNNTIVNGIGRIGWMSGGGQSKWVDEEVTLSFVTKAINYIDTHKDKPFFLSYHATEPHVPRMPATMFKGKSGLGFRGDAILQLDHSVGQLIKALKDAGIYENTMIIFTSDNGPVLDDGYQDQAIEKLNGHDPFGGLRGGKYSAFEAGTRVPFLISWPNGIQGNQVSGALVGQVDLLASFASFLNQSIDTESLDSENVMPSFLGKDTLGRDHIVKVAGAFSVIKGKYKFIQKNDKAPFNALVQIELGNSKVNQLYDLAKDPGEKNNIASEFPAIVKQLNEILLESLKPQK